MRFTSGIALAGGFGKLSDVQIDHGLLGKIEGEKDFWLEIRRQFPLTDKRTFFNNGTIGPSPYPVLEAVRNKMDELNAWGEYGGQEVSREPLANLLNVTKEEISLTHNTTEGINIVASGPESDSPKRRD